MKECPATVPIPRPNMERSSQRQALVCEFVCQALLSYAPEIKKNPRAFRKNLIRDVTRELSRTLQLPMGRPCKDAVTQAAEMRKQGKSWQQIYLQHHAPQTEQTRLRSAVRARLQRERISRVQTQ